MKKRDDRKMYRTTLIVSAPAKSDREHTSKLAEIAGMLFQDFGMSVIVARSEPEPQEAKR